MCCKLTLCGLGSHFLNGGQGRGWWFCLVDLTTVNWNGAQVRKLDITVWKLEANVIPLVGVFHLCRRRRKFILEGIFHRSSVSQKHEASLKSHNPNVGKRFMYALFIFFSRLYCFVKMWRKIQNVEKWEKKRIPMMIIWIWLGYEECKAGIFKVVNTFLEQYKSVIFV